MENVVVLVAAIVPECTIQLMANQSKEPIPFHTASQNGKPSWLWFGTLLPGLLYETQREREPHDTTQDDSTDGQRERERERREGEREREERKREERQNIQ